MTKRQRCARSVPSRRAIGRHCLSRVGLLSLLVLGCVSTEPNRAPRSRLTTAMCALSDDLLSGRLSIDWDYGSSIRIKVDDKFVYVGNGGQVVSRGELQRVIDMANELVVVGVVRHDLYPTAYRSLDYGGEICLDSVRALAHVKERVAAAHADPGALTQPLGSAGRRWAAFLEEHWRQPQMQVFYRELRTYVHESDRSDLAREIVAWIWWSRKLERVPREPGEPLSATVFGFVRGRIETQTELSLVVLEHLLDLPVGVLGRADRGDESIALKVVTMAHLLGILAE